MANFKRTFKRFASGPKLCYGLAMKILPPVLPATTLPTARGGPAAPAAARQHVLIPRSHVHVTRTQAAFPQALVFAISHAEHTPAPPPAGCTGLVLTSANVLPGRPGSATSLPVYAVGPATAAAAQSAGFTVAHTGPGTAAQLVAHLLGAFSVPQTLFHPRASTAETAWHPLLTQAGHTVHSTIAYTSHYIPALPAPATHALQQPGTAVLLFSPASAKHLIFLCVQATIPVPKTVLCLSSAVAAAVTTACQAHAVSAPHPKVAAAPTLAAMQSLWQAHQRQQR